MLVVEDQELMDLIQIRQLLQQVQVDLVVEVLVDLHLQQVELEQLTQVVVEVEDLLHVLQQIHPAVMVVQVYLL
jgi:hypothetical protein